MVVSNSCSLPALTVSFAVKVTRLFSLATGLGPEAALNTTRSATVLSTRHMFTRFPPHVVVLFFPTMRHLRLPREPYLAMHTVSPLLVWLFTRAYAVRSRPPNTYPLGANAVRVMPSGQAGQSHPRHFRDFGQVRVHVIPGLRTVCVDVHRWPIPTRVI